MTQYLESAAEIAQGVVRSHAPDTHAQRQWPEAGIRALQRAGLAGLTIPQTQGGLGAGTLGLAQVCETLGQECASTAICFGMHCVGASVIAANATPSQEHALLAPICQGEHLTTLALSEPGTGVHFYLPQTRITAVDGGYRVDGQKSFVTNGRHADSYVLSGVSAADGVTFSCIAVPNGLDGMAWGREWTGMGMRGNSSLELGLNGVIVPQDNLLGSEGDQIWYVFNVVAPFFLIAMAGTYLGVAQAALTMACEHVKGRSYSHSGELLAHADVMQHRIGLLWGRVDATRAQVLSAARRFDQGADDALPAVMAAKSEVADCAVMAVNEAMTLCGGKAYRDGGRLHQLLADARAAHVMAPTTDTLRTWIGRSVLDLPLLS